MNRQNSVKANTVNVQSQSSVVVTANAFQVGGDVTTRTIAGTELMNLLARTLNAKMEHSNVLRVIA